MTNDEVLVALAHLVGTPYNEAVKGRVIECTGRARVVGPADISTKEYDESRINVISDSNGLIEGFRFA